MAGETKSLAGPPTPHGGPRCLQEGISLYLAGVGPLRARLAAENLLRKGASALLSWGCAGGLVSNLSPGSLILPKTVIAADQTVFRVDARWHGYLCNRLAGRLDFYTEPLAENSAVLLHPSEKKALFSRTGAVAVDMESAAVATVAQKAGVPFVAIRAIVESADMTIPRSLLAAVDEFGRLRPFVLAIRLAAHPRELLPLIDLGKGFRAAHATLSTVAHLAGHDLLVPPSLDGALL